MRKIFLRLILSPFIFSFYAIILVPMIILTQFLIGMSVMGLVFEPIAFLLKKSGVDIEPMGAVFPVCRFNWINHIAGITINIWIPFFAVYVFVKRAHFITGYENNDFFKSLTRE